MKLSQRFMVEEKKTHLKLVFPINPLATHLASLIHESTNC